MNRIVSFLLIATMLVLVSCEMGGDDKSYLVDNPNLRKVIVKEVVQTSSYTYLSVKEADAVYWAAIPRNDAIEEGGTYYFDSFMEMNNFPSRELDKTFESIYFIERISDKPYPSADKMQMGNKKGSTQVGNMEIEPMEAVEGGITISELFENKDQYNGKKVKIRGHIVKFSEAIMGKNWAHIQDGTRSGGNFDLTITTVAHVEVGDIATFEGIVVLDKDFGYGYAYDLLIEEAVLLDSEKAPSLQ